jgi:hypothetical protein
MNTGLNFCRKCGGSLTGRTKFCGHCGTLIVSTAIAPPTKRAYTRTGMLAAVVAGAILIGVHLHWRTPPYFGSDPSRADKSTFARVIDAQLAQHCFFIQPSDSTKFPVSIATENPYLHQYDALVHAGLLTAADGEVRPLLITLPPVPGRTYSLTDQGRQALVDPSFTAFCAGHYAVDEVLEFTIPGPAPTGVTATEVTYSFSPHNVPGWAISPEVQAAFPGLANALAPKQTTRVDLVLTSNGWVTAE